MKIFVTGISGLIGSTLAEVAVKRGHKVWGVDNDNRGRWFGHAGSTNWRTAELAGMGITVYREDFRQRLGLVAGADLIVHCASQPSHDWSRAHPIKDFTVNALGTVELLDAVKSLAPKAVFAFMSTNKVYGDSVNQLDYNRIEDRLVPFWDSVKGGVDEHWTLDGSLHTPFGVSKTAADLMVQEYRRCFGLKTVSFRCGCLTGPGGTAVEMQGFLGYLVKCAVAGKEYQVYGHEGYQVRDNIDAGDVADAVLRYAASPKADVYNMGGGPENSISIREAVAYLGREHGLTFPVLWNGPARMGDHKWWVTNTKRFEQDYPEWTRKPIKEVIDELVRAERARNPVSQMRQEGLANTKGSTDDGGRDSVAD